MPERWPDLAGRITGGVHVLPVRVYYEDTDFSGAVYHANYLKFCERARSDCLRLLGIHHHRLDGMGFVVRRMVCDFLKPARIDDLLEVETRFRESAGARVDIRQTVRRAEDVVFSADVTLALVDAEGRPKRLPKAMTVVLNFHPE
ncbi:MAG: tol-pal system-associated acyl-CoA thioesterase [Rhizobiales bacterium]|nr:tol-pal system-associated acyl-CoA thioesterase [Hyphomicrobiales bacterium]